VLMGVGGAAVAGGVLWLVIAPAPRPAASAAAPGGVGVTVLAGGTF
jgi:hypothetical protein